MVSQGKKTAGAAMRGLKRTRIAVALERLRDGTAVKGRLKRHDRVPGNTGRPGQRFSAVTRHHGVKVEKADTGPDATVVRFRRSLRYDGAGAMFRPRWRPRFPRPKPPAGPQGTPSICARP